MEEEKVSASVSDENVAYEQGGMRIQKEFKNSKRIQKEFESLADSKIQLEIVHLKKLSSLREQRSRKP